MDPAATWKRLLEAIRDADLEEAREALEDLISWRDRQGYGPERFNRALADLENDHA